MSKRKIDELLHELSNVYGITYDILNAGFDKLGRDHDETVHKVIKYTGTLT